MLWDFAEDVVVHEPGELKPELFERCLQIKAVGLAKLTMGMFWLQQIGISPLTRSTATIWKKRTGLPARLSGRGP